MQSTITFGPYRLERAEPRLYKGSEPVPLQPRPLAVLCYLAARPGAVVGRDELIANVWAGTAVTRAVLKVAVRAIREALEDEVTSPRYIETVAREGYRLIADGVVSGAACDVPAGAPAAVLAGRAAHLAALACGLARATAGARQVFFVTGEAGIGKTTLIDRFVEEVACGGAVRVARGQCLEHHAEGEAYLPVLEALGSLAHQDGAAELADALRRHAPGWASQLPALQADGTPRDRASDATATMPARMLREIADALEALTQERTLLLVLEALHCSDRSTVDLVGCVARRRQPARLMVIGSLRPAQATYHDHPLLGVKHELQASGLCTELALGRLSLADVTAYIDARFAMPATDEIARLASRIHEQTGGNALFLVNVVDDLVARGVLARRAGRWSVAGPIDRATDRLPSGLEQIIKRRMHRLTPAVRRTLEAASVAGEEFTVAAVAGALADDVQAVEAICETLASQNVLVAEAGIAEWPDGSVTGRYRFLHALYRRVLYDGIAESRRVRLHRAIGLREEAGFAAAAREQASRLALHFARGCDHARALAYHELAAAAALDRHAPEEAASNLKAALEALAHLPDAADRAARQLRLVVAVESLLREVRGHATPETDGGSRRRRSIGSDANPLRVVAK